MKKEMLINVLQPEESRIAIVEEGVLEELYIERVSQESYVGNIYKGRVVNIEPAIQAAFVDFGVGRNGFLHVSDVEFQYYKHLLGKEERTNRRRPPMSEACETNRRSRKYSVAAAKFWCNVSRKESVPRDRPYPLTSAFRDDIWS